MTSTAKPNTRGNVAAASRAASRHDNSHPNEDNACRSYVIDGKEASSSLSINAPLRTQNTNVDPLRHDAPLPFMPDAADRRQRGPTSSSATASAVDDSGNALTALWRRAAREVASWRRGTVSIHETEPWLQFNVYIRRGFRHRLLRKREALGSIVLYFHNESFNIFSHVLAALVMLCVLLWPPHVPIGTDGSSSGVGSSSADYGNARGADMWPSPSFGSPGDVAGSDGYQEYSRAPAYGRNRGGGVGEAVPPAQVPGWLRNLRGLHTTAATTTESQGQARRGGMLNAEDNAEKYAGADTADSAGRSFVPQSGAASPRDMRSTHHARAYYAAPSEPFSASPVYSWSRRLVLLLSPWHLLSWCFSSPATPDRSSFKLAADSAALPAPVHVSTRLAFSLTPLTWCLLLTFVLSCTYHTFMPCCRSRRGYQQLLQCDVMGVLLSIGGSAYAYLMCGMPCASDSAVTCATVLVFASTLLCLYVVVLAPMSGVLRDGLAVAWAIVQGVVAWCLALVMEYVTGAPLHGQAQPTVIPTQDAADGTGASSQRHHYQPQQELPRGGGGGGGSRMPPSRVPLSSLSSTVPVSQRTGRANRSAEQKNQSAMYRALLAWVRQHRHVCFHGSDLHHNHQHCDNIDASTTAAAAVKAEPVHVTAHQRAAVMGIYCLLHLGLYRWYVYPKSSPTAGGFTQGIYYHNMSYVWLFVGGMVNAARFPERVVFTRTRTAARHTRRLLSEEAAAWCAEELAAEPALPATSGNAASTTWWQRFSFAKFMVTYVVSASTLDYVGNSHNIWHVCTMLSAFSNVLAVYYDCLEYDLVVCT